MQEEKPGEEERVVAKSKPMMSLVSKTANQSPTALGSSAFKQPGDSRSTQFEFRPYRHGETRCERFECKHIEFSSVAFRYKHDHQYRETCGGNDKGNHWFNVISPQLGDIREQGWSS